MKKLDPKDFARGALPALAAVSAIALNPRSVPSQKQCRICGQAIVAGQGYRKTAEGTAHTVCLLQKEDNG
jgi:hypothetical protein